MSHSNIDIIWILICTALVLLMQAGFCCLESGLVRTKNNSNVAIKNFADFCVSAFLFWAFGYSLMFDTGYSSSDKSFGLFFELSEDAWQNSFFIYQLMFCGAAVTITSGAVSERLRFSGYLIIIAIISSAIYPIFGSWVWAGVVMGDSLGWLAEIGFVDFAGASVVHSVGGWVALASIIIVGPRVGRFGEDRIQIRKHSLPLATLGVFLLWIGWFGFNGGSAFRYSDEIPKILINTILAGIGGSFSTLFLSWRIFKKPKVEHIINGVLAGLVGITAACNIVTPLSSIFIGVISGGICLWGMEILEKFEIDDVVGAVPAHVGGGIWGTFAVALFGDPTKWGTGLGRWDQFVIQGIGAGVCFVWSFGVGFCILWSINRYFPLRVRAIEERIGLNIAEHSMEGLTAKIEKDEALISSMVENIKDGIVTVDEEGQIETFNPGATAIFGVSDLDAIGKDVSILIHSFNDVAKEDSRYKELLRSLFKGERLDEIKINGQRADGEYFPLEISISQMNVEGHLLFVCIFRDITERQIAQEKLFNAKKEAEVLREEAENSNRAKSIFLANMSHEIRTPLNAVLGYAQILLRKKGLNKFQQDGIEIISNSSQNLLTMINEVLDMSKIESGRMELNLIDFDLNNLVEDLTKMFQIRCQQKGIVWNKPEFRLWHMIKGDRLKLRQVLVNLIGNAVKFTDVGEVSFKVFLLENFQYRFEVLDTGQGISEKSKKEIFEPFRQEDFRKGGTGLGLAIAKKQLDLMGSELFFESKEGKGSRFYFTLKLPQSSEIGSEKPVKVEVVGLKKEHSVRALIVEDVKEDLEVLSLYLKDIGSIVMTSENGRDALSKIEDFKPDIIFTDMRMPVMNGEEFIAEIQKSFGKNRFKLIAVTASVFDEKKEKLKEMGFDDFIGKPFSEEQIFEAIRKTLNVEFEYANESIKNELEERQLDFNNIQIDLNMYEKLKEAAMLNNITVLESLIEELEAKTPDIEALAELFSEALTNYDMGLILDTLEKINKK